MRVAFTDVHLSPSCSSDRHTEFPMTNVSIKIQSIVRQPPPTYLSSLDLSIRPLFTSSLKYYELSVLLAKQYFWYVFTF